MTLLKNGFKGASIGFGFGLPYLMYQNDYRLDRLKTVKLDALLQRNILMNIKLTFKATYPTIFIGAWFGLFYTLFYIKFWDQLRFKHESMKSVSGHAVFGLMSAFMIWPQHYVMGLLLGSIWGLNHFYWRNTPIKQANGFIYLPTTDEKIIEARKKAKKREAIYALSLDLLLKRTKVYPESANFD